MTVKSLVTNFTYLMTRKYCCVHGRAGRAEYWQWVLACLLIFWTLGLVGHCFHHPYLPPFLFFLAAFLPGFCAASRRLHDRGLSGWWQLLGLIPIAGYIFARSFFPSLMPFLAAASAAAFLIVMALCVPKGDPGENKYGAPDCKTKEHEK